MEANSDTAPGPDGFHYFFYQWDIVKSDLWGAVKYISNGGSLVREINHTFICLIPKKKNAVELGDFRPIACCNVLYKIISKMLYRRLQAVIGELITMKNVH